MKRTPSLIVVLTQLKADSVRTMLSLSLLNYAKRCNHDPL